MLTMILAATVWTYSVETDPISDKVSAQLLSEQGGAAILLTCKSSEAGISTTVQAPNYIGGWPLRRVSTVRIDGGTPFESNFVVPETSSRFAGAEDKELGRKILDAKTTFALRIGESRRGDSATMSFSVPSSSPAAQQFRKKCSEIQKTVVP